MSAKCTRQGDIAISYMTSAPAAAQSAQPSLFLIKFGATLLAWYGGCVLTADSAALAIRVSIIPLSPIPQPYIHDEFATDGGLKSIRIEVDRRRKPSQGDISVGSSFSRRKDVQNNDKSR